jgi:hypothetical protein
VRDDSAESERELIQMSDTRPRIPRDIAQFIPSPIMPKHKPTSRNIHQRNVTFEL